MSRKLSNRDSMYYATTLSLPLALTLRRFDGSHLGFASAAPLSWDSIECRYYGCFNYQRSLVQFLLTSRRLALYALDASGYRQLAVSE